MDGSQELPLVAAPRGWQIQFDSKIKTKSRWRRSRLRTKIKWTTAAQSNADLRRHVATSTSNIVGATDLPLEQPRGRKEYLGHRVDCTVQLRWLKAYCTECSAKMSKLVLLFVCVALFQLGKHFLRHFRRTISKRNAIVFASRGFLPGGSFFIFRRRTCEATVRNLERN